MVFVRKLRGYYVLAHAQRKGKRVVQKTKYLGKRLPSRQRLERLKEEFSQELVGQRHKYLSGEEIARAEKKKESYARELKQLGGLERGKRLKDFMIRFTYDSSKLSGIDVTLRQTSLILKDGIVPKDIKSLRTVKELENHEKGVVAITKYRGKLGIGFLKKLHKILFAGIADEIAGKLRSELKRDVHIAGTPYVPPKWHELDKEIGNFFGWYRAENRRLHALELSALVHMKIISMQPFVDGNSRLSRLLMNWFLWKKGYPMVDVKIDDLEKYYDVLDKYQIEQDEKPFVKYIFQKYLES